MAKIPVQTKIFLADGFEEIYVSTCAVHFRSNGFSLQTVGLSPGSLESYYGLQLQADLLVGSLRPVVKPELVLIPGSTACASLLLSDPRVFDYLQQVIQMDGLIAVASRAASVVAASGLATPSSLNSFIHQEHRSATLFVQDLVCDYFSPFVWEEREEREEQVKEFSLLV